MRRVGLIGFGAIGSAVVGGWERLAGAYELSAICVRPAQLEAARIAAPGALVTDDIDAFLAADVDFVIEAAGHQALRAVGERVLRSGRDVYTLSVGALADLELDARLTAAAQEGGGRLRVPAGALAGFEGLMTLREADLTSVKYISTKPPEAWRGTPAADTVDLDAIRERTILFRGTARQAAAQFPKNANLAAAVALAGLGFEATEVELVADPGAVGNDGRVEAATPTARLNVTLNSLAFADNPKSSSIVSDSVIASLRNAASTLAFC